MVDQAGGSNIKFEISGTCSAHRLSHPLEPAKVGCQRDEERSVLGVADAEFLAGTLDQFRQVGIVNVANAVEEVMLDLEVQSADEPGKKTIPSREIDRRLKLVDRPVGIHLAILIGHGEV